MRLNQDMPDLEQPRQPPADCLAFAIIRTQAIYIGSGLDQGHSIESKMVRAYGTLHHAKDGLGALLLRYQGKVDGLWISRNQMSFSFNRHMLGMSSLLQTVQYQVLPVPVV
ncbi:hypothetical protein, partial [Chitinilyticum piscinae]